MITLPFFVLVIEKKGDAYSGYSPNMGGVSATGSREEVEQSLIEQIREHVEGVASRHEATDRAILVTTEPVLEKITCVHSYPAGKWKDACEKAAQKDGLCWQHWKRLYGHEVGTRIRFLKCQLCNEARPFILGNWSQPCEAKTNKDWRITLEARRVTNRTERELERREKVSADAVVQCKGQTTKGAQCSNEAQKDGLCRPHWRKAHGHDYWSNSRGCTLCGETSGAVLNTWDVPCPNKK